MPNRSINLSSRVLSKLSKEGYHLWKKVSILFSLLAPNRPTVYLFGEPIHLNMGDQAQTHCIRTWLRKNHPGHSLVTFNWSTSYPLALRLLRLRIRKDDRIYCHSGYLMVDHHRELPVYVKVARLFRDHRIVIFPQTINLSSETLKQEVADAFNNHPDLLLLCRDAISHERAKTLFPGCRLLLFPDVVTTLIGSMEFQEPRCGVFFCIRKGRESLYAKEHIEELRQRIDHLETTIVGDTDQATSRRRMEVDRETFLIKTLRQFACHRLVITDRYHGTIFSLVAGTPVIVLSSADHKLESGVKWFPPDFSSHVAFARDLAEAHSLAERMLAHPPDHRLPLLFRRNYYDKLLALIEEPDPTANQSTRVDFTSAREHQ